MIQGILSNKIFKRTEKYDLVTNANRERNNLFASSYAQMEYVYRNSKSRSWDVDCIEYTFTGDIKK